MSNGKMSDIRAAKDNITILPDSIYTFDKGYYDLNWFQAISSAEGNGKTYQFITNNFHFAASSIAEIYKQRWQIELFFKWLKQNLKIKSFLETSENAVMS